MGAAPTPDGDRLLALGLRHHKRGQLDRAVAAYCEVLAKAPDRADVHHLLGIALAGQGEVTAAMDCYQRSLALDADNAAVHHDLGVLFWQTGAAEQAIDHYRRALALNRDFANAHVNLGVALTESGRPEDAVACFQDALALRPGDGETLYRLARALNAGGDPVSAIAAYRRCMDASPDHAEAHFHMAITLLRLGEFADGWAEYEWRFRRPGLATAARGFPQPEWRGEPLAGRRGLVWGEQAVGEEIMFAALIGEVAAAAEHCIIECAPRLVPLFERSFPGVRVVARQDPPAPLTMAPDIDFQCPIGGLGRWLRPDSDSFASIPGYLRADEARIEECRGFLDGLGGGLKVGISWRSTAGDSRFGAAKSSSLDAWAPILTEAGIHFVNLQYGDCDADLDAIEEQLGVRVHRDPAVDQMTSLDDFAAQIAALDLVITTANTTAHLAGALGGALWVLLPQLADWRWRSGATGSLWYPNARLMRQADAGDWTGLLARVAAALADHRG